MAAVSKPQRGREREPQRANEKFIKRIGGLQRPALFPNEIDVNDCVVRLFMAIAEKSLSTYQKEAWQAENFAAVYDGHDVDCRGRKLPAFHLLAQFLEEKKIS